MKLRATILFSKPVVNTGYEKFFYRDGGSGVENKHDNCVFLDSVCIRCKSGNSYILTPYKKTYTSTMNPPNNSVWVANLNFDIKETYGDPIKFKNDIHNIERIIKIGIRYDNDSTDIRKGSFATCLLGMSIDNIPISDDVINSFSFPEYEKFNFKTKTVYAKIPLEICETYPVDTSMKEVEEDMKKKFLEYIEDTVYNNPNELLNKFGFVFIHSGRR